MGNALINSRRRLYVGGSFFAVCGTIPAGMTVRETIAEATFTEGFRHPISIVNIVNGGVSLSGAFRLSPLALAALCRAESK